jgi:hypothetical protein
VTDVNASHDKAGTKMTKLTVPSEFTVILGGTKFTNCMDLIAYKGKMLFTMRRGQDGTLDIDFDVYDRSVKIATFRNGMVAEGDESKYDIRSGQDEYAVARKSNGQVMAKVQRRKGEEAQLDVFVDLVLPDGFVFKATPTEMRLRGQKQIMGGHLRNCEVGIPIE